MIKKILSALGFAVGLALLAVILTVYVIHPLILNREADPGKEKKKEEEKPLHDFETLIVNLGGAKGMSFLRLKFSLQTSSESVSEEIRKKKAELVDLLINILSQKTPQEIDTIGGKEKLKNEIIEKMNQKLTKGKVEAIYFTEFVIQ